MKSGALLQAHIELSETLRDTHYGHSVREFKRAPSILEFARAVGEDIPLVVRGIASKWPAIDQGSSRRWTNEYLLERLGDSPVTVSLTGDGYADAVRWVPDDGRQDIDGRVYLPGAARQSSRRSPINPNGIGIKGQGTFAFATPHEVHTPFSNILHHLTTIQPYDTHPTIAFCQLQNDCLRGPEYSALLSDVPDVIPSWARAVLGEEPEAVNFWMGRHESVTTLHSDPFENIYTVVRGAKTFTLYPPCDAFFFQKQMFPLAHWLPCGEGIDENDIASISNDCHVTGIRESNNILAKHSNIPAVALILPYPSSSLSPPEQLPWVPITHPRLPAPLYPRFASSPAPFTVCVEAGDSLYLPRGWLHMVEQEEDEDGVCVAVNAWYEGWEGMGANWGWTQFANEVDHIVEQSESGNHDTEAELVDHEQY